MRVTMNEIAAAVMNGLMNQVKRLMRLIVRSKILIRGQHAISKSLEIDPRLHHYRYERKADQGCAAVPWCRLLLVMPAMPYDNLGRC